MYSMFYDRLSIPIIVAFACLVHIRIAPNDHGFERVDRETKLGLSFEVLF